MYAEIVVPYPVFNTFYYKIPDNLLNKIKPGIRVKVNFRNRNINGVVVNIKEKPDVEVKEIKEVISAVEQEIIFPSHMWELARWMSDYYIIPPGEAVKVMIPSALREKKPSLEKYLSDKLYPLVDLTDEQRHVFEQIKSLNPPDYVLLYGVTGSGKTEIYLHLMDYFIKKKSK